MLICNNLCRLQPSLQMGSFPKNEAIFGWFLAGAEAGEDDGEGAGEDFQVEPEGPVVDVLEVEFHPLVEADLVAAADLPDAGEAGLHGEAAAMPRIVVLHLGRDGRPGADEAHVADENIPELRELVDAGATEETAERSDARVVLHLEDGAAHFVVSLEFRAQHFGIGDHRAELVHREEASVQAAAFLPKKDGAGRGEFDNDGDGQRGQRPENRQPDQGAGNVNQPFAGELPGSLGGGAENQQRFSVKIVHGSAGDGGLHEVGDQPRLDAFHLAGQDGFLDLTERGLADVEDHATDGEAVQQHGELGEEVAVGIKPGGDAQAPLGMFLQQFGKFGVPLFRSHEDDFRQVLPPEGAIPHEHLKESILGEKRDDAEQREERDDPATEHGQLEEVHRGHDRQGADGAAFEENPDGVTAAQGVGAAVEAVEIEQKRVERQEDQRQAIVIAKRGDHYELGGVAVEGEGERKQIGELLAQRVGEPKDDGDQQRIADLVDLNNKFSSSTRHWNTQTLPDSEFTDPTKCRRLTPRPPLVRDQSGVDILHKSSHNFHRFLFRLACAARSRVFRHRYVNQNVGPPVVGVVQHAVLGRPIDALPMIRGHPVLANKPVQKYRIRYRDASVRQFYVPGGIQPRHGEHAALDSGREDLFDLQSPQSPPLAGQAEFWTVDTGHIATRQYNGAK